MVPSGYTVNPGVPPRPKIWEAFKNARSVSEMGQVIDYWGMHFQHDVPQGQWLMRMAPDSIQALVKAKGFPHYPKNLRHSSDDKRIIFFAKVLAGLEHGLTPLYATKRLSHWGFSKRVSGKDFD